MNKENRNSLISGSIFLLFGFYLFISGFVYEGRIRKTMNGDVGSGFMPRLIGVFIILLSLGVIVSAIIAVRKESATTKEGAGDVAGDRRALMRFVSTVILMTLYMVLLKSLGFILTSAVYLFFQIIVIEGEFSKKKSILYGAISIVAPVFVYVTFVRGFSLMLPSGILG